MIIDNVEITASGFNPCRDELLNYVRYVKERVPNVTDILVTLEDKNFVSVSWTKTNPPFERIRRITGYLTGDLKSWNDAKQSEEQERVKHKVTS